MVKKPELHLEFNPSQFPVAAACSACRREMPLMKSMGASSSETMKWFTIQFDLHKRYAHEKHFFRNYSACPKRLGL
jgi:hypothetical protein